MCEQKERMSQGKSFKRSRKREALEASQVVMQGDHSDSCASPLFSLPQSPCTSELLIERRRRRESSGLDKTRSWESRRTRLAAAYRSSPMMSTKSRSSASWDKMGGCRRRTPFGLSTYLEVVVTCLATRSRGG